MLFINFKVNEPKRLELYGKTRQERRAFYSAHTFPDPIAKKMVGIQKAQLLRLKQEFNKTKKGEKLIQEYDATTKTIFEVTGKHEARLSELKLLDRGKKERLVEMFKKRLKTNTAMLSFATAQERISPHILAAFKRAVQDTELAIQELQKKTSQD